MGYEAAFGLASSALNALMVDKTNQNNREITNANNNSNQLIHEQDNAFNRQERLETQQFNLERVLDERAYNSPQAQASRLSAAGLNPVAIMDGDSAKTQSSISSSPSSASSPIPMQAYHSIAPQFDFGAVGSFVNEMASARKQNQDAKATEIDNQTRLQRNQLELQDIEQSIALKLKQKDLTDSQRFLYQEQMRYVQRQQDFIAFQLQREINASAYDDATYQSVIKEYEDRHNMADLEYQSASLALALEYRFGYQFKQQELNNMRIAYAKEVQEIQNLKQDEKLSYQQTINAIQQRAKIILETAGINLKNKQAAQMLPIVIESMKVNVLQQKKDYKNPFKYVGGLFGGAGTEFIKYGLK